jgi:3',5'-cyclic AMP phosphodiesterase CpdA
MEHDSYEPGNPDFVRFVCISDTHSLHQQLALPKGDVLLHSGDFTMQGRENELISFSKWLGKQDFKHKVVVSGNHEVTFDVEREATLKKNFGLE